MTDLVNCPFNYAHEQTKCPTRLVLVVILELYQLVRWKNELQKMTCLLTPLRGSDSTDLQVIVSVLHRRNARFVFAKLVSCRKYNMAFIEGSSNLRISGVKDHSHLDMHARAMALFSKSQGKPVTEYAPIAKPLNFLDAVTEQRLKKKFDIAYFICKQQLAFLKMGPLCELQARYGVDIDSNYTNNLPCTIFVQFIALEQRDILKNLLERIFFYIQCDGSTDSGNMEKELFLVIYLDTRADDDKVHIRNRFLQCVNHPVVMLRGFLTP